MDGLAAWKQEPQGLTGDAVFGDDAYDIFGRDDINSAGCGTSGVTSPEIPAIVAVFPALP